LMNEEAIFQAAADMSVRERGDYLDTACQGQPALRTRIERLLASHDESGFMARPVDRATMRATAPLEETPEQIGNYKLFEKIGEGGFGTVWMAEQQEPVRRRVALKIIKLGMDTKSVIARFREERQALAMMDHPNIAKVLDAGATKTGRPYFVMELVHGVKITDYCDHNQLSTSERLAMVVQVCLAIQHAHQKGIIHRDIKPSNILVTLNDGEPVPKVIDFGIAKATSGQRLTDATIFTAFEQFLGTPAYMSPEQAEMSGLDIDTRSDIYSLGILLYELLTGQTPFTGQELMAGGLDAMRCIIRDKEPPKPSTFMSTMRADARATVAKHRQVDGVKLIGLIRGDLDWIVMKCLEKNRARRYETANDLAADLKRHLTNEPVVARPPTAAYKFQKAWRRNKLAFSATAAVGLVLLLGISLSTWQASAASRARKSAEAEKITAQHDAYVAGMFSAGPAWEDNSYRMVRQLLAETRTSADRGFEWYYWQRQTHLNLITLYGHLAKVTSIAYFPEGQRIVTGSEDQSARVWDVAAPKESLKLLGHKASVNSVAVSPDGKQIATASSDQTVILWDSKSGRNLLTLHEHGAVNALAFSPDGQSILTGGDDRPGRIWDLATRQVLVTLGRRSNSITSVAFSPDGKKVVTASADRTAQVWRSSDGSSLFRLFGHKKEIMAVVFTPDGRKIVTGSLDQVGQFWDADTGEKLPLQLLPNQNIGALVISLDGRRIVTGSWNSTASVWNAANLEPELLLRGHVRALRAVAISPNADRVVTGGFDGDVKVWDADGDRDLLQIEGNPTNSVLAVAISPNGEQVAVGNGTFNNDGSTTGSGDQALQVWDARTKKKLLTIPGHTAGVSSVAFSPKGTQILSGSGDGTAKLWDAVSGALLSVFKGHTGSVSSVAFSPDGKRIATGGQDRTGRFWNSVTGDELFVLAGHTKPVSSVAVSPDGHWIVTGSHDETARVWEAATARLVRTIEVRTSKVYSIAFSPDSRRLAIAGFDFPTIWDLANTNEDPITLQGHTVVSSIAFSPDGKRIVTSSLGRTVKVWETATGRELLTLRGHTGHVYSVAISSDGQKIITGSADQTARIWQAATTNQVAIWEVEERDAAQKRDALARKSTTSTR
jgi:eukaryotic-like serine/threonine-protein kinase